MRRRPSFSSITTVPVRRPSRWDEQRASLRFVCGPGHVVALEARGACHLVPVYNMSEGGMMIRLPTKLALGEAVTVAVGNGTVLAASICWMDGERAGLAFRD
jgi:hypothetical protein